MGLLRVIFLLILLLFVGGVHVANVVSVYPLELRSERISFTIPAGSGMKVAAELIEAAGVEMPAWQLTLLARGMKRASQIKAGSYEVQRGTTAMELIEMMARGDVIMSRVTLVDGKTLRAVRQTLDTHPDLMHETKKMSNAQLLAALGASAEQLEGLFLPDTYLFDKGASDLDVLRRAYAAMDTKLQQIWAQRDPQSPLKSPYELLILASIVEEETGASADRPQIAAVFVNRLRLSMPLQSDPTVIYGLGERFDGNLRRVDLTTDTPWNTYTRVGLPPSPIALPSVDALKASSKPPASNKLYFVARGDGSSEFSATLDEHNRAVNRYQKGGRGG